MNFEEENIFDEKLLDLKTRILSISDPMNLYDLLDFINDEIKILEDELEIQARENLNVGNLVGFEYFDRLRVGEIVDMNDKSKTITVKTVDAFYNSANMYIPASWCTKLDKQEYEEIKSMNKKSI
tara:strand:- start:731 stop:1105 length:375 start_codon:yes stop_codon:yes gene_type:complete